VNWLSFFGVVLKSVLFSTGGFGPLPSLHADFIARGWASEKQFTEALAIGQITPGPNGLWVASLCYLVAGVPGAVLSCVALLLPPLLILIVELCFARIAHRAETQGALDGVVLVIVGFNVLVLAKMFLGNGTDLLMVAIAVVSAALAISRRVSSLVILAAAIVIGLLFG
jgi:chromate transporter